MHSTASLHHTNASLATHKKLPSLNTSPPLELTDQQKEAVNPLLNAWVEASAGSGKTKVLVDRLLTLMLSGVEPDRLLCVTFTKAAAAEMNERLMKRLMMFSLLSESDIDANLKALGMPATKALKQKARGLFQHILALPRGLRIQTLHSFAESFLRAFPLEAGLFPYFSVIDEEASKALWKEAFEDLFNTTDASLKNDLSCLVPFFSEQNLYQLFQQVLFMRSRLHGGHLEQEKCLTKLFNRWGLGHPESQKYEKDGQDSKVLKNTLLHTPKTASPLEAFLEKTPWPLYHAFQAILYKTHTKSSSLQALYEKWCHFTENPSLETIHNLKSVWLTQQNTLRQRLLSLKDEAFLKSFTTAETTPRSAKAFLSTEQVRFEAFYKKLSAHEAYTLTAAFIRCASFLLRRYETLKRRDQKLDYDDLLFKAAHLLEKDAGWVRYKMDKACDHILIDEAQDTSKAGWRLIQGLMDVFFVGESSAKTLFVVGDPKQSIYSFQGADPKLFHTMQTFFQKRLKDLGRPFRCLSLHTSFRSAPLVLEMVDAVFSEPLVSQGVSSLPVHHRAADHLKLCGASLTLWPLINGNRPHPEPFWQKACVKKDLSQDLNLSGKHPALESLVPHLSPKAQLALSLAIQIQHWLENPLWLESQSRFLKPSDILILVRKRGSFIPLLIRFLKERKIPIEGQDRLFIKDTLIIKDLMAIAALCITPFDDLQMAVVLKGPFFRCSEDQLMALVFQQGRKSLWETLQRHQDPCYKAWSHTLEAWQLRAQKETPLSFFHHLLFFEKGLQTCLESGTGDTLDVIYAFLGFLEELESETKGAWHQLFSLFQEKEMVIKREGSASLEGLRFMTVHGAKGLESPVVIIPEAADVLRAHDTLLWSELEETWVPFFTQKAPSDLKKKVKEGDDAEYRRLLYVALTRATEHILVCGTGETKKSAEKTNAPPQSWYTFIQRALEKKGVQHTPDPLNLFPKGVLRIEKTSTPKNSDTSKVLKELKDADRLPSVSDLEKSTTNPLSESNMVTMQSSFITKEPHVSKEKESNAAKEAPDTAKETWLAGRSLTPLFTPFQSPSSSASTTDTFHTNLENPLSPLGEEKKDSKNRLRSASFFKHSLKESLDFQKGFTADKNVQQNNSEAHKAERSALRGTLIHRLLEVLPLHPEKTWPSLAHDLIKTETLESNIWHTENLKATKNLEEELTHEAISLLKAPHLQFLHHPEALREVNFWHQKPQEGVFSESQSKEESMSLDTLFKNDACKNDAKNSDSAQPFALKTLLRGCFDFVLPLKNATLLIDYKSDLLPKSVLPDHYRTQLLHYKSALKEVYTCEVLAAILWTRTRQLSFLEPWDNVQFTQEIDNL